MKMSDNNSNRKTAAQQTNASHYEQARAHLKGGLHNSAAKANNLAQNPPESKTAAAIFAARTAMAGGKEFGKSAKHAGMGFMEGVSKQNPNSGQQLNNMKINQSITQGRQAAQSGQNKGIESARQKTAAVKTAQTGKSNNQGIKNLQNKTSGQSSGNSKSVSSGTSKGSGSGSGQSGGSSKGR